MNRELIKMLIKYKLNTAKTIVDSMPPQVAEEIRDLGRTIMEGINEGCKDVKVEKASSPNKLNNIDIE